MDAKGDHESRLERRITDENDEAQPERVFWSVPFAVFAIFA